MNLLTFGESDTAARKLKLNTRERWRTCFGQINRSSEGCFLPIALSTSSLHFQ